MSFTALTVYQMLAAKRAETVTLRRLGNSPPDDITLLAKIDDVQPVPLAGTMAQNMRNAIISNYEIANSSWPAPPRRNDQIITSDGAKMTISAVSTTVLGTETVMHNMKLFGG